MLKLEMVRFHYTDALTIGVLYDRAGWLCYTLESPVRITEDAFTNQRVLPEGLYSLILVPGKQLGERILAVSEDGKTTNSRFCAVTRPHEVKSDIAVGYSADLFTGNLGHSDIAVQDLQFMVKLQPDAFLSVRHIDDTLAQHLDRLRGLGKA